jgi:carbon-monoxide dehydrogenase large subunit
VAHGRIKKIDTAKAAAMPGVLAIFTGEDFKDVGGNPAGWLINSRDGTPMREPKRPVLAHGKVRHVGDAYAAVMAETCHRPRMPPSNWPTTA